MKELKDGDWEVFRDAENTLQNFKARLERQAQLGRPLKRPEFRIELRLAIYRGGCVTFVEEGQ